MPAEPTWLNQVHGTSVVVASEPSAPPTADATVAFGSGAVCAVLTADCLPVLFCDRAGTRVAAAHAGWRGLVGGVLAETIKALNVPPAELLAWLGPAIEQDAFEVGPEVLEQFVKDIHIEVINAKVVDKRSQIPTQATIAFTLDLPSTQGRWGHVDGITVLANWLPLLAYYDDNGWQPTPFIAWPAPGSRRGRPRSAPAGGCWPSRRRGRSPTPPTGPGPSRRSHSAARRGTPTSPADGPVPSPRAAPPC